MDYRKAYGILFRSITDAIHGMDQSKIVPMDVEKGITILKEAQIKTEETHIAGK